MWRDGLPVRLSATRLEQRAFVYIRARLGTPAQVARTGDDGSMFASDGSRQNRKNTPGEQSMRRSIQDLVSSIDPNVKVDPEVEDVRVYISYTVPLCLMLASCSCCLRLPTSLLIRSPIFRAGWPNIVAETPSKCGTCNYISVSRAPLPYCILIAERGNH